MTAVRALVVAAVVTLCVTVQLAVLPSLAVAGVVPNLVLIVVVGLALARGSEYGALAGFAAGLALDVAPPADHTAGRWALAFVVVGYLAGLARRDTRTSAVAAVLVVAAGSFIGTSLFALSGLVLRDPGVSVDGVLQVIPTALVYDIVLTPFVVPVLLGLMRRLDPVSVRL